MADCRQFDKPLSGVLLRDILYFAALLTSVEGYPRRGKETFAIVNCQGSR